MKTCKDCKVEGQDCDIDQDGRCDGCAEEYEHDGLEYAADLDRNDVSASQLAGEQYQDKLDMYHNEY